MIDSVPVAYSKITLRCARTQRLTRIYHIIRNEEMQPLYVLFDDSCFKSHNPYPSVKVKMNLTKTVYFNKWETDEGILI